MINQLHAQVNTYTSQHVSCSDQPALQIARSKELKELEETDQKERENWENISEDEALKLKEHDLIRRMRVGEIFAEGCLNSAEDYIAASLIYQHGGVSDHYYQAYIWSKRAIELGDLKQKGLMALTIDRYLVSIGKKQLFGSQAYGAYPSGCFCLQQTEMSFPDSRRKEYTGLTLQDRYDWLSSINQQSGCLTIECTTPLEPSHEGTFPGLW